MPETKQLTKLRALPLPPAIRALADELAASQRQLDGMRAAGAAAVNVEKMRDQMLTAAEQKVSRHYSLMRQGPQAVVSQIKREYVQQPHGREQEQRAATIAAFSDDLALMQGKAVADLAASVAKGKMPQGFTRSHVACLARECRMRGDVASADAIGKVFPFDPSPWTADPRWRDAQARLEHVESLAADSRVVHVADAKGSVKAFTLDDLLL